MAVSILLLLLSSCRSTPQQGPERVENWTTRTYNQEAVTLHLRMSKQEMTVADRLELILEISGPEDIEVEFPAFAASLGDFTLVDTEYSPERMTGTENNVLIIRAVHYLLEPYLPGSYTLPAMIVKYRGGGDDAFSSIKTAEVTIPVKSLLPKESEKLEIRDITGPRSLPDNTFLKGLLVIILLLLAGATAAGFLYWKKSAGKRVNPETRLRPDETALQELDSLVAEKLLARGEVKLFHLRISDILRHYIENRFGFKAPERTTEEFLTELSRSDSRESRLLGNHKPLLTAFLTQCDLVKFARHEPAISESEKTVSICREFIDQTKEKPVGDVKP